MISLTVLPFAEKSSRLLARLLAVGVLLLVSVSTSRADLTNGLVAYYPFDGNASDMSGNGLDGNVTDATLGTDRHGAAGKAYDFTGSASIKIDSTFEGFTNFTNSFWVKVSQSNSQSTSLFYNANGAWGYDNAFPGNGKVVSAYVNYSRQAVVAQQNKSRYLSSDWIATP